MAGTPPQGNYERDIETLIFLHLPKTAGISMSLMLTDRFPAGSIYHIRDDHSARSPVFAAQYGSQAEFLALPAEARRHYRLVLGHMHFGLHERVDGVCSYFTVLRHPVERVLSAFGQKRRAMEKEGLMVSGTELSFEEFCRIDPDTVDNLQTRMLCGWPFSRHSRQASLERAKENLSVWCRVVGTQERFQETAVLLQEVYGLGQMVERRRNVGTHRPAQDEVAPAVREWIAERNGLDIELCRHAESLLDRRIDAWGQARFAAALAEHRRFLAEDARLAIAADTLRMKSRQALERGLRPVRGFWSWLRRGWSGRPHDTDQRGAA